MNLRLWKRLAETSKAIENRYIQYLLIIMQEGDTWDDLEAKVERWKAGEKVDGIYGEYEGGPVKLLPFEFVSPSARE